MSYTRTIEESTIHKESEELGIETPRIIYQNHDGYYYKFIFESQEDMNLYKLNGSIKENQVIRFDTVGRK